MSPSSNTVSWTLTGLREGECEFKMAYADAQQLDWDRPETYQSGRYIEFDVKISFWVPGQQSEKPNVPDYSESSGAGGDTSA